MRHPIATDEEVAAVAGHWAAVEANVHRGVPMPEGPFPDRDTLSRVARHQRREAELLCEHPGVTIEHGQPLTCTECRRPVKFLSDVQVEELVP